MLKISGCSCFLPFIITHIYPGRYFRNLLGILVKLISDQVKGKTTEFTWGRELIVLNSKFKMEIISKVSLFCLLSLDIIDDRYKLLFLHLSYHISFGVSSELIISPGFGIFCKSQAGHCNCKQLKLARWVRW